MDLLPYSCLSETIIPIIVSVPNNFVKNHLSFYLETLDLKLNSLLNSLLDSRIDFRSSSVNVFFKFLNASKLFNLLNPRI